MHKFAPFACHECKGQAATALVVGVFVCPRHPATGFEDLARRRDQRIDGTHYAVGKGDVLLLPAVVGACLCRTRSAVSLLEISLPEGV